MQKINAVILAGSNKDNELLEGINNKAFLPINGRPMLEYIIEAIESSSKVGEVSVIGPVDQLKEHFKDRINYYYEEKEDLFDNLRTVIEPFKNDEAILLISSDIPLIKGHMIDELIAKCAEVGGDLCYPIVEREQNEKQFPGIKRTYVKLKEGSFTGGNIFYFNPDIVETCAAFAKKFIEYRKKPWKSAQVLGFGFLLKFITGTLTIQGAEKRFSQLLNITGRAVVTDYGEVANDVDKPSDIEVLAEYFA